MDRFGTRCRTASYALGLFLLIFGAKLALIDRFGSDIPFWDQWAKEGELLYAPWFEHGHLWQNLFLPHSEHRIAPTLALNLALVAAGGQWDARTQCVANAALDAAVAVGLYIWAMRRLGTFWGYATYALILVLFSLPLAWDNVLGGFQSGFYFLVGFSLIAMNGLISYAPFSSWWFVGLGAGLAASVSMGSGFLCFLPVAGVSLVRGLQVRQPRYQAWVTPVLSIGLAAVAWSVRAHAPWHDPMHAQTLKEFLLYFVHCLCWPTPQWPWLAAILWLPFLWAVINWIRLGIAGNDTLFIVAGGLWVLMQISAISYARGVDGGSPAPRYGSFLMMGVIFPFMSLAYLGRGSPRRQICAYGLLSLFMFAGASIYTTSRALHNEIPERKELYIECERSVRAYVTTGDMRYLNEQRIPFPDAKWLARILDERTLRKLLPASINENSEMSKLSRFSAGLARKGIWVISLGATVIVAITLHSLARHFWRPNRIIV